MFKRTKIYSSLLAVGAVSLMSASCSSTNSNKDDDTASIPSCSTLVGMEIPASDIGLATKGAKVTSATLIPAADALSKAEHCLVVGEIYPVTESETIRDEVIATPNINFNVALPSNWNNKTLQYGGGGFNGSVPSVDRETADVIASGLARGYATLGSDSGHIAPYLPGGNSNQLWNSESLKNFGREQIKKTHDVAASIVSSFYDASPQHSFFQGGSQGGHEALIAAGFYPDDYDGVIVGFPAYNLEAMHLGSMDYGKTLYNTRTAGVNGYTFDASAGDGWISPTQTKAISEYLVNTCDSEGTALDGAADGMVSDPGACREYVSETLAKNLTAHDNTNPLRCENGVHESTDHAVSDLQACLSDPQIESLSRITSRYNLPEGLVLEAGLTSYGRWPMLDGIWIAKDESKNIANQEDFGTTWDAYDAFQAGFPSIDQYNIITQSAYTGPSDILIDFDPADWIERIKTLSGWVDANSVDFSTFSSKGGKMIHYHGGADISITPYNSIDLYLRMVGQFTTNTSYLGNNSFWKTNDAISNSDVSENAGVSIADGTVNDFYSFYLIPGYGHGKGYYKAEVDWLTALEDWVEEDTAPKSDLVSTDISGNNLGSRPLCYFPYYPKYTGEPDGDIASELEYTCTKLAEYSNL